MVDTVVEALILDPLEALAAGTRRGGEPSFLDRAKTRWGARNGKGDS